MGLQAKIDIPLGLMPSEYRRINIFIWLIPS